MKRGISTNSCDWWYSLTLWTSMYFPAHPQLMVIGIPKCLRLGKANKWFSQVPFIIIKLIRNPKTVFWKCSIQKQVIIMAMMLQDYNMWGVRWSGCYPFTVNQVHADNIIIITCGHSRDTEKHNGISLWRRQKGYPGNEYNKPKMFYCVVSSPAIYSVDWCYIERSGRPIS